jgi:hypothetical protein
MEDEISNPGVRDRVSNPRLSDSYRATQVGSAATVRPGLGRIGAGVWSYVVRCTYSRSENT